MANLEQLNRELAKAADAANKRLGRMDMGQKKSAEYYAQEYSGVIMGKGGLKFSKGAAKSEKEARQRLKDLRDFMAKKGTTRKGWQEMHAKGISHATDTLNNMGFNVTQKELEQIIKETGGQSSKEFYLMQAAVSAAKEYGDEEFSPEELADIISERRSEQQTVEDLIRRRQQRPKTRRRPPRNRR